MCSGEVMCGGEVVCGGVWWMLCSSLSLHRRYT